MFWFGHEDHTILLLCMTFLDAFCVECAVRFHPAADSDRFVYVRFPAACLADPVCPDPARCALSWRSAELNLTGLSAGRVAAGRRRADPRRAGTPRRPCSRCPSCTSKATCTSEWGRDHREVDVPYHRVAVNVHCFSRLADCNVSRGKT